MKRRSLPAISGDEGEAAGLDPVEGADEEEAEWVEEDECSVLKEGWVVEGDVEGRIKSM
jgi:hypothetical protein